MGSINITITFDILNMKIYYLEFLIKLLTFLIYFLLFFNNVLLNFNFNIYINK